jgi:hypothetical protein
MPSPEINKVREYWDRQASAETQPTIEQMRLYDDYWATPLPASPRKLITYTQSSEGSLGSGRCRRALCGIASSSASMAAAT